MATGMNSSADGVGTMATGMNSSADGVGTMATGMDSSASGTGSSAMGMGSSADGNGTMALGRDTTADGEGSMAVGMNASAAGSGSTALGMGAVAIGSNVTAIGREARAEGFDTNAVAIGTRSLASGSEAVAIGADSQASFDRSIAIGIGATTTRSNQVVLGTSGSDVTIPALAGEGSALVGAGADGTLTRSGISLRDMEQAVNNLAPAARGLGQAAESAGAMGAALSGLPEVSLNNDEPARCGVATGGYGSQYAVAGGCALRIADRIHLNGALAYSPSIDYVYGSTPSVAGRLGFSFPIGRISRASARAAEIPADEQQTITAQLRRMESELSRREATIASLQQANEAMGSRIATLESQVRQLLQRANPSQ